MKARDRDDVFADLAAFATALAPLIDKAKKLAAIDSEIAAAQAECNALNIELGKARRQKAEIDSELAAVRKKFRGEV